jgi:L-ribulose-5-phosphate 4-epimerase
MGEALKKLREEVLEANLEIVRAGLVVSTFGNVSGICREEGLVVIKPSGVEYASLTAEQMVVFDLEGETLEGPLRPSSDLPTHLALYQAFPGIGGVTHTHSSFATSWAQANREIPCLGTTHADYFYGSVPITRQMREEEILTDYERNTGLVITERFADLDPREFPSVLVSGHGPFCWGRTAAESASQAILLEAIAKLAFQTIVLNPEAETIGQSLLDKHFLRKHGPKAYYGQS